MKDIIPSRDTDIGAGRQKIDPTRRGKSRHIVEVSWKLPARLQRPIAAELEKEREVKRRRDAVVRFERRPIDTRLPSGSPPRFASERTAQARGAEQHTGDVYMHSRPKYGLNTPPYHGPGARGAKKIIRPPLGRRRDVLPKDARVVIGERAVDGQALPISVYAGERDIPYDFPHQDIKIPAEDGMGGILEPRRWSPSIFSWPRIWHKVQPQRLLLNLSLLGVGCLIVGGLTWQLDSISQSLFALHGVKGRVLAAYENVAAAQSALAEADFSKSEEEFVRAELILKEAQSELDAAVISSRTVAKYGENFLQAGEELVRAGTHISRGMELLLGGSDRSLTAGLEQSRDEFKRAVTSLATAEELLASPATALLPSDIRDQANFMRENAAGVRVLLEGFIDKTSMLLTLLGAERESQYLLAFQNNHELRPTGGFIGSIGLVDIDEGRVENIDISSVYDPDGQLKDLVLPPEPLQFVTDRWYLRDSNWFIDFPTSAKLMSAFFEKEGGPTVDGVIAFTPEVVRSLLAVTGSIDVPLYGVEVNYENFWEVAQDQVSYSYDKELNKPKQFLADLAPLILDRLFALPAHESLAVLDVVSSMLREKHMLIYFRDEQVQRLLAEKQLDGMVPRGRQGLLAVNNANIGGHKTDQFIEQEIDYRLHVQATGDVEAEVLIRRSHNGPVEAGDYPYPPEENPVLKDNVVYQRVLVPEGAELIDVQGFSDPATLPVYVEAADFAAEMRVTRELAEWQRSQRRHSSGTMIGTEAGYTSFANWMVTKPGTTSVALYRYRLPGHVDLPTLFNPTGTVQAFIVKQPGDMRTSVRVSVMLSDDMRIVQTAPTDGITQNSHSAVVYRSGLDRDRVIGVVFEHD